MNYSNFQKTTIFYNAQIKLDCDSQLSIKNYVSLNQRIKNESLLSDAKYNGLLSSKFPFWDTKVINYYATTTTEHHHHLLFTPALPLWVCSVYTGQWNSKNILLWPQIATPPFQWSIVIKKLDTADSVPLLPPSPKSVRPHSRRHFYNSTVGPDFSLSKPL